MWRLPLGTRTILGVIYQTWRSRTASRGLWKEPGPEPGLLPWGTEDFCRIGHLDLSFLTCCAIAKVLTLPATSSPQGFSADLPPQRSAMSWETFEVSLYLKDKMLCILCCGLSRGSACSTHCLLSQREAFGSWANEPDPGGLREIEQCLGAVGPFSVCAQRWVQLGPGGTDAGWREEAFSVWTLQNIILLSLPLHTLPR